MKLFKPRWRKVIRDMWGNKSRTALVVLSIAVGIFAIGVVTGSRETVLRVLNESYLATNPASGSIIIDDFGDDLVETIDGLREVEAAEGRHRFSVRYKVNPRDRWQQLQLTAAENFKDMEIGKVFPEAGEWPPPDKKLVLERTTLSALEVEIGDTLIVQTADGKERTMEIAGTVQDLSGPPAGLVNRFTGFVGRDSLEWLDESRDFNWLVYVVAENKSDADHIEAVGTLIKNKVENSGLDVRRIFVRRPPGEHPVNDLIQPLILIMTGLGGLALLLSGFLVVNTISGMLSQQTRQIGIMKAIGARRAQIMRLYFVTVLIYGFLSLAIALPLSAFGAWALTTYLTAFFNTDLDQFIVPYEVIIIQVGIGLLVPLLVAVYPIIAGTRITVREAINEYGVGRGKFGTSSFDRLLQQLRGISRPSIIAVRNTFRRKGRLSLTLITLTLAGTTFITIFSVRDALRITLDENLAYYGFDLVVIFEDDYRLVEIERAVSQIQGIRAAEGWGSASVNIVRPDGTESDEIDLNGLPANTELLQPEILEGRWLQPDDTNAVVVNTDLLKDEPDLQIGDQIVLNLESKDTPWQIVGVIRGSLTDPTIYANQPYLARITNNIGKARALRVATDGPPGFDSGNPRQLAQLYTSRFEKAGLDVTFVFTLDQIRARQENSFNFLINFLLAMAAVLAAVGGLGLSGTMSMNVLERVREIGVVRAIGASDLAVLRLVLVEGVIIGLLSWLAGMIVSLPVTLLITNLLGVSMMQRPLTFTFSFSGALMWLGIAVILAAIASFLPARGASRLTVREVLAYE